MDKILNDSKNLNEDYQKYRRESKLTVSEFMNTVTNKYTSLYNNHNAIFSISTSDKYDFNRLKFMLEMSEKIKKNEISEHDASVQVGQVLVDEIVKPQLKK